MMHKINLAEAMSNDYFTRFSYLYYLGRLALLFCPNAVELRHLMRLI